MKTCARPPRARTRAAVWAWRKRVAISFAALCIGIAGAAVAAAAWTWTLYERPTSVVLAQEIADTPVLGVVFECRPNTGQVTVTLYPERTDRDSPPLSAQLTTRSLAFTSLSQTGRIRLTGSSRSVLVTIPAQEMAKLTRFAEVCGV